MKTFFFLHTEDRSINYGKIDGIKKGLAGLIFIGIVLSFSGCNETLNPNSKNCRYVASGYDCDGYSLEFQRGKDGILRSGFHLATGLDREGFSPYGFNRQGFDRQGLNSEGFDWQGFNREGFNGEGFNGEGFNREGFNREGFNRQGVNYEGFNQQGYDRHGLDNGGFDRLGIDQEGFGREGFDRHGLDRQRFDRQGFNLEGFDRQEFHRNGFNRQGVHRHGLSRYRVGLNQRFLAQIQLGNNYPVAEFLEFVSFGQARNADFINADLAQDDLADFIVEFQEFFWELQPHLENIIQLIRQNGGTTEKKLNLINTLKRGALQRGLIRTGAEYAELMGEIIPNGFESEVYLNNNTLLIFDTIGPFVEPDFRTLQDANLLKTFAEQVRLHIDHDPNRPELVERLTRLVGNKKQRIADQAFNRAFDRLRNRVIELFNEVEPEITPESKFKYFLIRDDEQRAQEILAAEEGECLACGDPVDHETPGIACRGHNVHFIYHTSHRENALHPDHDCLFQYVRDRIQRAPFPINCGDPANPHELPITATLLLQVGLDEADIQHWKIQTLLAYYNELRAIQNRRKGVAQENQQIEAPLYRQCRTEACRNIIFQNEIDPWNHNYKCVSCREHACYLCNGQVHLGLACGGAALDTAADWRNPDSNLRPCPYCLTPAAKDNGCNKVICGNPSCRRLWHFIKGKPRELSFIHDFNPGAEPPARLYRVIGDLDYVPGQNMESTFPDSDGAIR